MLCFPLSSSLAYTQQPHPTPAIGSLTLAEPFLPPPLIVVLNVWFSLPTKHYTSVLYKLTLQYLCHLSSQIS